MSKILEKINPEVAINTIRMLGVEAIARAKSGHPGIVLGAAPIMYELFFNHLNVSPTYLDYFNHDRFVLSAGHGSALLYATMLTAGFNNLTMDDLKQFRQINSKTPGHPENHMLHGVEVSTGPLGQGIAMAVGMAIAEEKLSFEFNKYNKLIDHYTYCLFGDGDLEEGISYEACSVAGRQKLNKLIMIYDSNGIQLDGKVIDSTKINVRKYFKSLGWNYIFVKNGNNYKRISYAIKKAKLSKFKPTIIECKTIIGFGSDVANTNSVHGAPLLSEQIAKLKINLNYDYEEFFIPTEVKNHAKSIIKRVDKKINKFNYGLQLLEREDIDLYNNILKLIQKNSFDFSIKWYDPEKFPARASTRNICGDVIQQIAKSNQTLLISSADLTSSTKVVYKQSQSFTKSNRAGHNINLGVREFAMVAINNGIVAHGGCKAMGSTFLAFSDYCKAAIRLAAISQLPTINIFSHDSILVGEDGPTHQPIEQIWTLRCIPNHYVFRPTSTIDMIVAMERAINSVNKTITIITSRSDFDQINVDYDTAKLGGYEIVASSNHDITLYATGSEIEVAVNVSKILEEQNLKVRVIAINSLELLNEQTEQYKNNIFDYKPKISIEFGTTTPWYKYVDFAIGVDVFGLSGKPNDVLSHLNLTNEKIASTINKWYKLNYNK